jgi:hypothetical protein
MFWPFVQHQVDFPATYMEKNAEVEAVLSVFFTMYFVKPNG